MKIICCSYSSWSGQGNTAAVVGGRTSSLVSEAILKRKRITEYCLYGKKQSHYQNEEKQCISAKLLNTNCDLVCMFERDVIPLFFVSNVWGTVFNGMGQTGSSWDMDLIPYCYKQKHISCWTLHDEREEMGQEFKHYTVYKKREGKYSQRWY